MKNEFSDFTDLDAMKNHPVSGQIDQVFKSVMKEERHVNPNKKEPLSAAESSAVADKELNFDMDEIEIDLTSGSESLPEASTLDEGMDLSFSEDESLDLGTPDIHAGGELKDDQFGDLSLDDVDFSMGPTSSETSTSTPTVGPAADFSMDEELSFEDMQNDEKTTVGMNVQEGLSLSDDFSSTNLKLSDDEPSAVRIVEEVDLSFGEDDMDLSSPAEADLSEDAKEKLKEIDAIMDFDATQVGLTKHDLENHLQLHRENLKKEEPIVDENLDEPLVSEDLDLGSIDFGNDEKTVIAPRELPKKKKKEPAPDLGRDLSEISGAYSGEMERMQATISNLRADREELLAKIQKQEEDKVLQARQPLTMRAELDEKKIELTIIRKKLNEELTELKDRLKLFDEKKLILEEKNRILMQELDKANQKNKIDVKKVQMRERELEQKLELLKSDAESQIRHRDLKILELKRKIDAMEFDMESITMQEKRSVESRFELEDKLEKAIKTLRGAITVLEDESDRSNALEVLKKNIDM